MSKAHRKSVEKNRQPFRQPNMHITAFHIKAKTGKYHGICTCGWEGPEREFQTLTEGDCADHIRGMSRQQNSKEEQANRRDVAIRGGYNEGGGYSGGDE